MGPPVTDQNEAERRFQATKQRDPFPLVPPALLNSSDVYAYAVTTCMICPFEERLLKSSTYSIRIGDTVIYWEGNGQTVERQLAEGEPFTLRQNSIVFVKTLEKFRLPPYMAVRFNLKINNVHKGILLGTGPLVDPGFEGYLLVPLHNLTSNNYTFRRGDTFVWVEFSKTSPCSRWDPEVLQRYSRYGFEDKYKEFPGDKKNRTEWQYLVEAYKGPIRSSIPDVIVSSEQRAEQARQDADAARRDADDAKGSAERLAHIGFLSGVIGLAALFIALIGLFLGVIFWALPNFGELTHNVTTLQRHLGAEPSGGVQSIENRLERIEQEVQQLEAQRGAKAGR